MVRCGQELELCAAAASGDVIHLPTAYPLSTHLDVQRHLTDGNQVTDNSYR
jgi:hypothetical protein